jgi:hypothetical protein
LLRRARKFGFPVNPMTDVHRNAATNLHDIGAWQSHTYGLSPANDSLRRAEAARVPDLVREEAMALHAPSVSMFVVSLALVLLAVVSAFTSNLGEYALWTAVLAYIVLAVGNLAKT